MEAESHRLIQRLQAVLPQKQSVRQGAVASTGCPALDARLPETGVPRGTLVEWIGSDSGSGASLLAFRMAREVQEEGAIVVVDRRGAFYPPAAAALRNDLNNMIVVHPANEQDEQWSIDQALRCEHVGAVVAWPQQISDLVFRRWQLAAERGGTLGLLVRPALALGQPSWAGLRMSVTPRSHSTEIASGDRTLRPWRLEVELLRCRGLALGRQENVIIEVDQVTGEINETSPRHLAAEFPAAPLAG